MSTAVIIEIIVSLMILSVLGYMAWTVYGPSPNGPTTHTGKCVGGYVYDPQLKGCVSAGAKQKVSSAGACKNGSRFVSTGPGEGICVCDSTSFGPDCGAMCSDTYKPTGCSSCVNGSCGSCSNGKTGPGCRGTSPTCTSQNCQLPGCKDCKCQPGFKTSGKTGQLCDECEDGMGPPGKCDKKHFTNSIKLFTPCMWRQTPHNTVTTQYCQKMYGNLSSITKLNGDWKPAGTGCGGVHDRFVCNVPSYYANPSFSGIVNTAAHLNSDPPYMPPGFEPDNI